MKKSFRYIFFLFSYTFTFLFFFPGASSANYVLIPAQAPAIITTPDYVDSFQAPSPSALSGQIFRSKEGYLFSFDASGRRVYHMHASYVLSAHGSSPVPVHIIPYFAPQQKNILIFLRTMDAFKGKRLFPHFAKRISSRTTPPRIRTSRLDENRAVKVHTTHDPVETTESIRNRRKLRLVGALQRDAPLSCGNAP